MNGLGLRVPLTLSREKKYKSQLAMEVKREDGLEVRSRSPSAKAG
jgi:hypothetical protein